MYSSLPITQKILQLDLFLLGYGNIAPKTDTGKIVTILYAIIGIPLLLLCLSNIGDAMAHSFRFIYWKVCCYLCANPKSHNRRIRSNRSTRYISEPGTLTMHSTDSSRDLEHLGRRMYSGPTDSFDRQRSYTATRAVNQSLSRNHSYYSPTEVSHK